MPCYSYFKKKDDMCRVFLRDKGVEDIECVLIHIVRITFGFQIPVSNLFYVIFFEC
jgi:hypothetical protein